MILFMMLRPRCSSPCDKEQRPNNPSTTHKEHFDAVFFFYINLRRLSDLAILQVVTSLMILGSGVTNV